MAQDNDQVSIEQDEAATHYDVADNGSIILGWMLIAILVLFGGLSVVMHEPATIEVVQENKTLGVEDVQSEQVKHPIPETKQTVPIENEENLIHTRLTI